MEERCSMIQQILDREEREFEEAMREQMGTIFSSTNDLNNLDFNTCLTKLVLSPTR